MTKYCPHLPDVCNYVKQGKLSSQPVVLTNPFPSPQHMVSQAAAPPSGGASSSSVTILMIDAIICLSTQVKNYDQSEGRSTRNDTPSTSQPDCPLTLEKPSFELPSHTSKETIRQTMHNFNTRVAQHYSIIKDLSQVPCAMSSFEVL